VKQPLNLFGLTRSELEKAIAEWDLPPYRARQIYRWMYARGVTDFAEMTDLPRQLRMRFREHFVVQTPEVVDRRRSGDGTIKYLLGLEDERTIEAVCIPDPSRESESKAPPSRVTVCLSTQVGCPLACTFCYSGTIPFSRNLTVGEVLAQFHTVTRELDPSTSRVNVVYMGMGEPLLNADVVLRSLSVLTDPDGFAVSPRRVTVSTAGLVPQMDAFFRKVPSVGLAVSLHAPKDGIRGQLMPINRKHPLGRLMETIRGLPLPKRRRITFEYVLLGGENDREQDALELARLLRGTRSKVNLIAYNPWPGSPHRPSTPAATDHFMQTMVDKGYTVSLRRSRGADVMAACGQLAGRRRF
jgi:23S rRNA (adenine2503-C2)-methyltransferase